MERKVAAGGGIGLPLAVIVAWAWNSSMPESPMPTGVEAALGAILVTVTSWLVPAKK